MHTFEPLSIAPLIPGVMKFCDRRPSTIARESWLFSRVLACSQAFGVFVFTRVSLGRRTARSILRLLLLLRFRRHRISCHRRRLSGTERLRVWRVARLDGYVAVPGNCDGMRLPEHRRRRDEIAHYRHENRACRRHGTEVTDHRSAHRRYRRVLAWTCSGSAPEHLLLCSVDTEFNPQNGSKNMQSVSATTTRGYQDSALRIGKYLH
jgi:hypothetical protein